ncbi:hypothetical protein EYZ11_007311 [Aspergillus tanneri]|uniref:Uncharacterized protein n=1 Tax=Aspergillus tanneri TaxID=1220188 RepID=A0A4S3JD96_9EURO|nr:hypothetical protein EYZ11_007311 [Aspergillus tanneri]
MVSTLLSSTIYYDVIMCTS